MITAAQLGINVIANTAPAQAGLARLGAQIKQTHNGMRGLAMVGLALGLAVVGIGIASVKMAGDFQQGLTSLVTGAGESQRNLKLVSDGILQLATDTGTSTKQLIDGMYMIESAGFHGAAGLDVLKAAAEGAKVGNADLGAVANGVTTIMVDYKDKNISAAQATNILIATVANGKTHMQDLATAMSSVLPAASAVHVSLIDASGAMATMTGEGTNAAEAATYLRQLLLALASPAHAGAKALAAIGLTSQEVSDDMKKSLPDTLKLIMQHLAETYKVGSPEYVAALKAISGGSRQMQGILELTGSHLATFAGNTLAVADAAKKGGKSITGWALVQDNFNLKVARGREFLEALGIKIGGFLLPAVGKLVDGLSPLITAFGNALPGALKAASPVLDTLGRVMTGSILPGLGKLVAVIATDVLPVVVRLAGVFITNILPAVAAVFKSVTTELIPSITHLWSVIAPVLLPALVGIGWILANVVGPAIRLAITVIAAIINKVADFVGYLTTNFGPIMASVGGWFSTLGSKAQTVWDNIKTAGSNTISTVIDWFNKWKPIIITVGGILAGVFGPSIVLVGAQAVIAGAQIAGSFIAQMVVAGASAIAQGAIIATSFVVSMVDAGVQAIAAGLAMTVNLIPALISTSTQFAIAAAQGIAAGTAALVEFAMKGYLAAGAMLGSVVPAVISTTASFVTMAVTAIAGAVTGFIAYIPVAYAAAVATIAATWPVLLIIAAVALLVTGIILLATHWKQVTAFLQGAWKAAWSGITTTLANGWNAVTGFMSKLGGWKDNIGRLLGDVGGYFGNLFTKTIPGLWTKFWKNFQTDLSNMGTGIMNFFTQTVPSAIGSLWGSLLGAIKGIIDNLINTVVPGPLQGPVHSAIGFASGGQYPGGSVAVVGERGPELFFSEHRGSVVSNSQVRQALGASSAASALGGAVPRSTGGTGAGGGSQTVVVQIDQNQLMRIIMPALARSVRTQAAVRHM